jgi:ABC-2 type transport system permease protein
MLWQQTRAELLKLARNPGFCISSLALPLILLGLFGLRSANALQDGVSLGLRDLASFGAYGVMSVMLYSFGASLAVERGQRVNLLVRATPLPPFVALIARAITALIFTLVMLAALFAFGIFVGGVQVGTGPLLTLTGYLLLGSLPFLFLGFAIGQLVSPTGAAPVTNISFLVLVFASGIFTPIAYLPDFIQKIAPYLPTYKLDQLALSAVGAQADPAGKDIQGLLIFTAVFALLAVRAYRFGERRTTG